MPPDLPDDVRSLEHYRANPLDFFVDVLGVKRELIWSAMHDMTRSVIDNRYTAVAGCHDSSKTFTASCLSWWWVICFQPAIVYVTGPDAENLKDTYWAQLVERYEAAPVPLGGTMTATKWNYSADTKIVSRTARRDTGSGGATGMQGYKSQRLLMIFDESTGIDRNFWESARGVTGPPDCRMLALGNPTSPNCGFRDCWRPGSQWNTINIDALANPNLEGAVVDGKALKVTGGQIVHPYLANPQWVEDALIEWGEGSPSWDARVRGQFPSDAVGTLIGIADLRMAMDREAVHTLEKPTYIGVDIAAQGDDFSVLAIIRDDELAHLEWWHEPSTMKTAQQIAIIAQEWGLTPARADQISVDSGGLGRGVYDRLVEMGWNVNGEDFGRRSYDQSKYHLRRTELWVGVRDWLRSEGSLHYAGRHSKDWIRHLEGDLCGCLVDPFKIVGEKTLLFLEKKLDMKKRIGHSPDWGDALALALAHKTRRARIIDPADMKRETVPIVDDFRKASYEADKRNKLIREGVIRPGFYEGGGGDSFYDD